MDEFNYDPNAPVLSIETILDNIVEDVKKEWPDASDFEASFIAVSTNLKVLTQTMATIGMIKGSLDERTLYAITSSLVQTCQWMAAKELAAMTLRDIDQAQQ